VKSGRFSWITDDDEQKKQHLVDRHLVNDYFGRLEWPDSVEFQLPYGEWIRLFRRNGLVIEDLIETRPAPGATSTYRSEEESEWARHWPMENIWRLRKASGGKE
jgi:hypothetical protein